MAIRRDRVNLSVGDRVLCLQSQATFASLPAVSFPVSLPRANTLQGRMVVGGGGGGGGGGTGD